MEEEGGGESNRAVGGEGGMGKHNNTRLTQIASVRQTLSHGNSPSLFSLENVCFVAPKLAVDWLSSPYLANPG